MVSKNRKQLISANKRKTTVNTGGGIKIEWVNNNGTQNMYLKKPKKIDDKTFSLSKNPSQQSLNSIRNNGQPESAMKDTQSFHIKVD